MHDEQEGSLSHLPEMHEQSIYSLFYLPVLYIDIYGLIMFLMHPACMHAFSFPVPSLHQEYTCLHTKTHYTHYYLLTDHSTAVYNQGRAG